MSTSVELYQRAAAFFGEQVVVIGDDEWDLPTIGDWVTKAVVAHVVVAEAQIPEAVEGRAYEPPDVDMSILGHDPVSVWRGTAVNALQAIGGADLERVVDSPRGAVSLAQIVGFRITENLVHGWDIASARGVHLALDPEIAAWCLDFWLPFADRLAESGAFAPMLTPSDDQPGTRLLALLGRAA